MTTKIDTLTPPFLTEAQCAELEQQIGQMNLMSRMGADERAQVEREAAEFAAILAECVELCSPENVDVKAMREAMGMTRIKFEAWLAGL